MLKLLVFVSVTALCCAEIDRLLTTALPWTRYEIKYEHPAESTQPSLPGSPGQSDSETVQTGLDLDLTVKQTNQLDLDPYVDLPVLRHALTSKKCYRCRLHRECGPDKRASFKHSCGKFHSKKGGIILTVDLPNKSELNTVTVCKNSKLNGAKIKEELRQIRTNKKCTNSCANFTLCPLEAKSSNDCFQRQPLQMYVSESNRIYDIFTGENMMCHNCLVMLSLSAQVGQQGQVQTRCFPISLSYGNGHDSHKTRKRRSSKQAKPAAHDLTLNAQLGGALNHTEKIPIDGSRLIITNNPRNLSFEGVKGSKTSPIHPKTGDGPKVTPIDFNLGRVGDSVTSEVTPENGGDPQVTGVPQVTPGDEPVKNVDPETSPPPTTTEKDPEPEPDPFVAEKPERSKLADSGNCFKMGKTVLFLIQFVMFFYCL